MGGLFGCHVRIVNGVEELTTRPYQPSDAPVLTALMNTVDEAAGARPAYTVEDVGAELASSVADFGTDSRLTFTPGGTLIAAGLVSTPPPSGFRVHLVGGVHPDWRGQGLGRALLGWQYERAVQIHAARAAGAQWQTETFVMTDDTTAARLLTRLGFAPARYFSEMVASTKSSSGATLPEGLRSEPPTAGIEQALYQADTEAFNDHWDYQRREYDAWLAVTVRSDGFQPDLSRVAFDGAEIAGYVLSHRDLDPSRIYISRVGTRSRWRGKGVASALLAEVIEASARAGYPYVCLGVDADSPTGAVGVYERAGFAREHVFVAYRRPIG